MRDTVQPKIPQSLLGQSAQIGLNIWDIIETSSYWAFVVYERHRLLRKNCSLPYNNSVHEHILPLNKNDQYFV